MICDDSALFRRGLALLLTDVGVDVVGEAADVAQLQALLPGAVPDAVVLDIRMPGLDGWQVIDRLPPGSPPVLVVTADGTALERAHPMLLAKPYRPEELVAAVAATIERSTSP